MRSQLERRGLSRAAIGIVAALAIGIPATSWAQGSENDPPKAVDEIVVKARNIEESLQDVPVAVTAVGSEVLESFRIDEAADLVSRIPTLNIQVGGSGASAQVSLRGVGSSNISNAFDSAVALNFDDISVSTQRLLESAFFDVEQVALMKGPQSLFFGKAASAGVLALQSANPTEDWEYGAKVSYEFEEDGYTLGGYASGPITETLGIRIAAEWQDIDKFVELGSGVPTRDHDRGLENLVSRLTLHWAPNEDFSANLKLNYNRRRSETLNATADLFCGADGLPDPSVLLGGAFGGTPGLDLFLPNHDCDIENSKFTSPDGNALINRVPRGSPGATRNVMSSYNDTDTYFVRLKLDYAVTDWLDLTFLAGYIDLDNEYSDSFNATGQNPNGSPAGLVAPFNNTLEQWTTEIRLVSDLDGPFNFQFGAFFEDRDIGHRTSQNAFNPSLLGVFGPPFGPDALTGYTFDWLADRPIEAEALSFFVSGQYRFNEQWELSGGVRWTDEEKSTSVFFPFVHAGVGALLPAVPSGFRTGDIEFEDDNWSPEVVLRYTPNDDVTIYGAFKTGFKSGGVDNNTLPTGGVILLNSPIPSVREAAEAGLRFESEESEGGEVGYKSVMLDGALTFNAVAYYYVFENLQLQNFDVTVFNFDTTNAGELTTWGLDLDWIWTTPIDGLTLYGALSYLSSEFTDDDDALEGRDAARAPDWSGTIGFDYVMPLGDSLELRFAPHLSYTGDYLTGNTTRRTFSASNPLGNLEQDDFVTIDAVLSVGSADGKWTVSLIANNLADEQWINTAGPAPFLPTMLPAFAGDDQQVSMNRGRQVFIEVAFAF